MCAESYSVWLIAWLFIWENILNKLHDYSSIYQPYNGTDVLE